MEIAMNRLLFCAGLGLSLLIATSPAAACRIAGPPFIPLRSDYDAIALATAEAETAGGTILRLDEALYGRLDSRRLTITYAGGPGEIIVTCGHAARPVVHAGDRLVVAFRRDEGRQRAVGWATVADAAQADEFFALYPQADAGQARGLLARWREVTRRSGPVPTSDPSRWMVPYAGALGWTGPEHATLVAFRVDDDGRLTDCHIQYSQTPAPRDRTICPRLAHRRFSPPLFAREHHGLYQVRWGD